MSVEILIGDVLARLADVPDESVDCVVTSPPYWGLRNYEVEGQYGLEPTLGEHIDLMVRVFDTVRKKMKPLGTLWLNYGDCYAGSWGAQSRSEAPGPKSALSGGQVHAAPKGTHTGSMKRTPGLKPKDLCMVPNRLAIALQEAGWWVRSEIVWGKPNPMPDSSGRYRPSTAHEKLFLLTKSAMSYYDSEAVRMPCAGDEISNGYPGSDGDGVRKRTTIGNSRRAYKTPDNWDTTVGEGGHGSILRTGREKGRPTLKQAATADAMPDTVRARRSRGLNERWDASEAHGSVRDTRLLRNYEPDLSPIIPPEVWAIATAGFSEAHFATFPPALVTPCILAGCPRGGTVLDPFGGAGTTGLVADRLGRECTLIELNPEYADLARDRLRGELCQVRSEAPEPTYEHGPLFGSAAA